MDYSQQRWGSTREVGGWANDLLAVRAEGKEGGNLAYFTQIAGS